MNRCIFDTL